MTPRRTAPVSNAATRMAASYNAPLTRHCCMRTARLVTKEESALAPAKIWRGKGRARNKRKKRKGAACAKKQERKHTLLFTPCPTTPCPLPPPTPPQRLDTTAHADARALPRAGRHYTPHPTLPAHIAVLPCPTTTACHRCAFFLLFCLCCCDNAYHLTHTFWPHGGWKGGGAACNRASPVTSRLRYHYITSILGDLPSRTHCRRATRTRHTTLPAPVSWASSPSSVTCHQRA